MEINNDLLDKLASLSKLQFEGEDKEAIKADLERMLAFVEKLNELDTENVAPLIHMTAEINRLREDIPGQELDHEEALKNAPAKDSDYFRVPKVKH